MNIRIDAVSENSKEIDAVSCHGRGGEEEERRAQIDGTLDEVVEASSSVVAGS